MTAKLQKILLISRSLREMRSLTSIIFKNGRVEKIHLLESSNIIHWPHYSSTLRVTPSKRFSIGRRFFSTELRTWPCFHSFGTFLPSLPTVYGSQPDYSFQELSWAVPLVDYTQVSSIRSRTLTTNTSRKKLNRMPFSVRRLCSQVIADLPSPWPW